MFIQCTYINYVVIGILWKFFIFLLSQQVFVVVLLTIPSYNVAVSFSFDYSNGITIVSIIFLRETVWGSLPKLCVCSPGQDIAISGPCSSCLKPGRVEIGWKRGRRRVCGSLAESLNIKYEHYREINIL